jgi:V8-like Glu-specific endopeptidase
MKNSICKIENINGEGTGFFCEISNKKLLITNNHVIDEKILKEYNEIIVKLYDNKKKYIVIKDYYTSKKYDTTIIEINSITNARKFNNNEIEESGVLLSDTQTSLGLYESKFEQNINYLQIDDEILDEKINLFNKSIYVIQYPKFGDEQKAAVSFGILNKIQNEYNIIHFCNTDFGSSGSPILRLSNKKIIGIHKEGDSLKKIIEEHY